MATVWGLQFMLPLSHEEVHPAERVCSVLITAPLGAKCQPAALVPLRSLGLRFCFDKTSPCTRITVRRLEPKFVFCVCMKRPEPSPRDYKSLL
ncbi:hypothetical protein NDU88_001320 [Pleurodeles waltl]|uniref:Secreted protein n=1 Tax=Pleurodeles waltl TaxID=8319 RepID=A0AAV7NAE6_PLEWA|nr:hypothetical protein NDU88_001320 [Pleurodeles waltl]